MKILQCVGCYIRNIHNGAKSTSERAINSTGCKLQRIYVESGEAVLFQVGLNGFEGVCQEYIREKADQVGEGKKQILETQEFALC